MDLLSKAFQHAFLPTGHNSHEGIFRFSFWTHLLNKYVCGWVSAWEFRCPARSKEQVRSPAAGITDSYEPHGIDARNWATILWKTRIILSQGPSYLHTYFFPIVVCILFYFILFFKKKVYLLLYVWTFYLHVCQRIIYTLYTRLYQRWGMDPQNWS